MGTVLRKVLIVDDDDDIRVIGRISLAEIGRFEVLDAASGSEALRLVDSEPPDVILLDVMMPGMDGPTFLDRLRRDEQGRSIPVIFLTAKAQKREIRRFLDLGAAGVIPKPFDPLTLAQEMRRILGAEA